MVLAKNRVSGRELCTIGRHINELVAVGHVACRIDTRHRRTHVIAHNDGPVRVGFNADVFQPHTFGIGPSASGRNKVIRRHFDRLSVLDHAQRHARVVAARIVVAQSGEKGDPFGLECFRQCL